MELTPDQVLALAPDTGVAASGKRLATPRGWLGLGRDDAAIWGEIQGSARYQVRAALADLAVKCSCPSRKFPCKHGVGLLLIAATTPDAIPHAEPPGWVTDWLARHATTAQRAKEPASSATEAKESPRPGKATERRRDRVSAGLDALDLWLDDLLRGGLAQVGTQPTTFWERQAKRLTDAQAPGLAALVRRMAALPNASRDWPARLLAELGKVALLSHAYRRIDGLPPPLQDDLRAAIGWTLTAEEVAMRGEIVADRWAILSARVTVEDRLRTQAIWLRGLATERFALILQFAHGAGQFAAQFAPGTLIDADLAFWPGAFPQRAIVRAQRGEPMRLRERLRGDDSLETFLGRIADASARLPWLERHPALLADVTLMPDNAGPWRVRDACGATLPLAGEGHWQALALTGGAPCDLAVEWDGEALLPLSLYHDGHFTHLSGGR